jgi:predicted glutamine amidotransferase
MLAVASRSAVREDLLLAFRKLSDTGKTFREFGCPQPNPKAGHPDGWGIAAVGREGELYARGAGKASTDPKYEEAVRRLGRECTPPILLLAHVRRASVRDSIREEYSHPFRREVDGRIVFFGHNGEIEGFGLRGGKIDSQEIFDRFLEALGPEPKPVSEFRQALGKAKEGLDREWHRKVESYTFLMIDGRRIVAHRDARTCVPYYTLHATETEAARIVCSEVLPNLPGRWRMLRNGEFVELAA